VQIYPVNTVAYKVFIKKNYKVVVRWAPDRPWYLRHKYTLASLLLFSLVSLVLFTIESGNPSPERQVASLTPVPGIHKSRLEAAQPGPALNVAIPAETPRAKEKNTRQESDAGIPWKTITVTKNDNLALIFDRLGLSPGTLFKVLAAGDNNTRMLKHLVPGEQLHFRIDNGSLEHLRYEPDLTTMLDITRSGADFNSTIVRAELEKRQVEKAGIIQDSLFLAGQKAGLSDNIIMRMVSIYGWDIDFALDIRSGDSFKVIYEEQFKNGKKAGEGPIIAAEFINQGRVYRTVRYTTPQGQTGYFNEDGYSMRKAFLRTPVKFSRISSRFSLHRKHPILNLIRAHKGVDYAAPTGTPIKATGDGTVIFAGTNGGYGRSIKLKHGSIYTTVYAHMSRFARGITKGKHVDQGDIIGYVGSSGLATGPHLHYEFRVNGVYRDPLTVKLPKALRIPDSQLARFKLQTAPLLAMLDNKTGTKFAAAPAETAKHMMVALKDSSSGHRPSQ
jgi:murein DD-endopeptidase MepM/ murein hydrolase activator NlpD